MDVRYDAFPQPQPFAVNIRFNKWELSKLDTVNHDCSFSVNIVYYWTDTRFVDWPNNVPLPENLWGPELKLMDGKCERVQNAFVLVNSSTGRLKRGVTYTGVVNRPQNLRDFPFDIGCVVVSFESMSNWMLLDGSKSGNVPAANRKYKLQPVSLKGEGRWLGQFFKSRVPEFSLLGVSTQINEKPRNKLGNELTAGTYSLFSIVFLRVFLTPFLLYAIRCSEFLFSCWEKLYVLHVQNNFAVMANMPFEFCNILF
jgi:hypothetical protein